MPFTYYARLTRAQQAIYRQSDATPEIRLPHPAALHPLVAALESALQSEDRAATQAATARLIAGLAGALRIPPVRVEVLAARPHRGWGELHGLYTTSPGKPPTIQLWMRTAKQRRVVAFRTYLRTLLHEVGHHVDYTYLGLKDSFHTEGFYRRESSLFAQLVPGAARRGDPGVHSPEEWSRRPLQERLDRMERTPRDLAHVLRGHGEARLARPPVPSAWSPRDIVCHLRDTEDRYAGWIRAMLTTEAPLLWPIIAGHGISDAPEDDRTGAAWDGFSRRRDESLLLLATVDTAAWERPAIHPRRGRLTVGDLVSVITWHDEHHLEQVRRALGGAA